jgi:predicted porin
VRNRNDRRIMVTTLGRLQVRRSAVALAMFGLCAGTVRAQSSVTLYGSLDGGLRNVVNGSKATGAALTMASNGVYNSSRWGFIGEEDLGGGLYARFNLEGGFILSTGAFDNTNGVEFQRTSTVGLGGPWGIIDFGRQFTLQHFLVKDFEPLDFHYLSISESTAISDGNTGRDDNDIYYKGNFGPIVLRGEYAVGGQPGSLNSGSTEGAGFSYHTDALKLGVGYTHKSNQFSATSSQYFGDDQYTAGGAFTVGKFTAMAGYSLNLQGTPASAKTVTRNQYLWGGFRYLFTPALELSVAYYDDKNVTSAVEGTKSVSLASMTYSLSKRTLVYTDIDYTHYTGGAIKNTTLNASGHPSTTGISVGINHLF